MTSEFIRFDPPRRLVEYLAEPALLNQNALDAIAYAKNNHSIPEYVVRGEYRYEDGRRVIEYGVSAEFIEANSDYRRHPETHNLRLFCPNCELWDGKHRKTCDR